MTYTINEVIDQLVVSNNKSSDIKEKILLLINTNDSSSSNLWYINMLIVISGWLAVIPFFIFFHIAGFLNNAQMSLFTGFILICLTVIIHYFNKKILFVNHLNLALNYTGQIVLFNGIALYTNGLKIPSICLLLIQIVLSIIYNEKILRFICVIIATISMILILYSFKLFQDIHIIIFLLSLTVTLIWTFEKKILLNKYLVDLYKPFSYGFAISLLLVLIFSVLPEIDEFSRVKWLYSSFLLSIILILLEAHLLNNNKIKLSSMLSLLTFFSSLIICALFYKSPGIIGAFIILLISFNALDRLLTGISILFLTAFFIIFYYNLEISLLSKSISLMCSGLFLLFIRFIWLKYFYILKEEKIICVQK